ncbi:MAG: disulfide bond formation protein B [Alphaproteobacteria bacterium]|nr:disulfide bond formation protein B [Alphaproteobacteria bacterium]
MYILSYPKPFFTLIVIISALALAGALTAQYAFGLEPCMLCLYQRWPFALAIGLGMMGRGGRNNSVFTVISGALLALTFAGNAALAFYHSGVERKWWPSVFESCSVPDLGSNPDTILERIMNAPTARCDEIPWADPVLGLSMANYNVALCAGLALLCLYFLATRK